MLGGNWNTQSAFQDFTYYKGSGTDFLGFDGGKRSLNGGMRGQLNLLSNGGTDLLNNGFNNDWLTKSYKPLAISRWLSTGIIAGRLANINSA